MFVTRSFVGNGCFAVYKIGYVRATFLGKLRETTAGYLTRIVDYSFLWFARFFIQKCTLAGVLYNLDNLLHKV